MDLGRMAVWLRSGAVEGRKPLIPHSSSMVGPAPGPRARPCRGVRATAERERSGKGACLRVSKTRPNFARYSQRIVCSVV